MERKTKEIFWFQMDAVMGLMPHSHAICNSTPQKKTLSTHTKQSTLTNMENIKSINAAMQ